MPSSGARSGTKPSRNDRGAGDGRLDVYTQLRCGCLTQERPLVTGTKELWYCAEHKQLVGRR